MKLIALKDLPNNIRQHQHFEENAIIGAILINAGAARADGDVDESPKPKRTYRRRVVTED